MTQADLYNSFPDDLKEAIRAYEPLESKTTGQLHQILIEIRNKLHIAPWHPFTLFMKHQAQGQMQGKPFLEENFWAAKKLSSDGYTTKKYDWLNVDVLFSREGDGEKETRKSVTVAVSPAKDLIWSYMCEGPIKSVKTRLTENHNSPHTIARSRVFNAAKAALASHTVAIGGTISLHFNVTAKKEHTPLAPTLQDILTPDPEAPKAIVDPITDADKEVLLTMLEMASLKLKEFGMYSTLSRWRATVRRLTKHEIQTEAQTDTSSGTT